MKTKTAIRICARCTAIIIGNTARAVDHAAHRYPWAFILAVLFVSTAVAYINIGQARLERDAASHNVLALRDTIQNLHNTIDAKTYLQR